MEVEWMMFAEGAEVVNNKLYMMGAGWDSLLINNPLPAVQHLAIAVTFLIPWGLSKTPHPFALEIRTPDNEVVPIAEGMVQPGMPTLPPLLPHARAHMAVSSVFEFKVLGTYQMVVKIGDRDAAFHPLRISPGPFFPESAR